MRGTSTERLDIRAASASDLPTLCDLLGILFSQESEFQPNVDLQRHALEQLLAMPHAATIWVAREAGQIVAMLSLQYVISTALGGRVAWLEDVIVHPQARGRRIGERLLKHALESARGEGCLRVSLLTDADNTAAQRFYQRQGFLPSRMRTMRWLAASQCAPAAQDQSDE